jgi:CDP-diacylglycerol--glycerol-3-phosphate 3-phosphatidyltransferase
MPDSVVESPQISQSGRGRQGSIWSLLRIDYKHGEIGTGHATTADEVLERGDVEAAMTPNQITAARVVMAFAAMALLGHTVWRALGALARPVAALGRDALDGYLARRRKLATPLGAQLDILGDRVVENLFFTFFAVTGLVSLWIPVLFFVRGALTDFLRGLAARSGRSGFGKNSMLESWWGKMLVASRASRAAYATLKCICFCALGLQLTFLHVSLFELAAPSAGWILWTGQALVLTTAAFCLVRAVPVIWEGRRYFGTLGAAEKPMAGA